MPVHVVYCFQMSIESDRGHDIVTIYYEIIHAVVSGKFCSKMCTGVHKLVLCRKMMFSANESCKFNHLYINVLTATMQVHNKCSCCLSSITPPSQGRLLL